MSAQARPSAIGPVITRYLALKTALGRRYAIERRVLETLETFLQTTGPAAELTPETFEAWAQTLQHLAPPFVLLTREIFASREQILLHLYAATGVSCRTVDRSAVRSAVIAFRPDGVRW